MRTPGRVALAVVMMMAAVGGCDGGLDPAGPRDDPSALQTSAWELSPPPPAPPCGSAPHKSSKISTSNLSDTYTRPFACQSWTVHQATFTIPTSHPYRRLWVQHSFDYSNLSNPQAKCDASTVEFKTERQVTFGNTSVWLTVDSGSGTPQFVDSTQTCFWHNYNGNTGPTAPGTVIERISARALRYNGSYDKVTTGARMQAQYIP